MGALLTSLVEQWLAGADAIDVHDEASVGLVRAEVRRVGAHVGGSGRIATERLPGRPYQTLLMYSDGIGSRFRLGEDRPATAESLRLAALAIAHQVLARFGRDHDDVLVLVAR